MASVVFSAGSQDSTCCPLIVQTSSSCGLFCSKMPSASSLTLLNSRSLSVKSILGRLLLTLLLLSLCYQMCISFLAFFAALLPISVCDVFPHGLPVALVVPLFLGASTVSTCHFIQSSKFPTCAFIVSFRPRRAFVAHGLFQQRNPVSASFPVVRWTSGRRSSSMLAP